MEFSHSDLRSRRKRRDTQALNLQIKTLISPGRRPLEKLRQLDRFELFL